MTFNRSISAGAGVHPKGFTPTGVQFSPAADNRNPRRGGSGGYRRDEDTAGRSNHFKWWEVEA